MTRSNRRKQRRSDASAFSGFEAAGYRRLPVLSIPPALPRVVSNMLNWNAFFPPYLINYFKYPVILDGRLFVQTFG